MDKSIILSAEPHSLEAEQAVLGAVLADTKALDSVIAKIKPEHFYVPQHKAIYGIILKLFTSGQNIDVITVLDESVKQRIFDSAKEGRQYFSEIGNTLPSTANIDSYCRIITDKYTLRSLSKAAHSILDGVQSASTTSALLDSAEQMIYDIRQGKTESGLLPIADAVSEAYSHIGRLSGPDKEKYSGIKTGYGDLDRIITGLNKSDLIIIASRPGMGKTSFSMNIAGNAAQSSGKDVAVFSLEMSRKQLASRMLSSYALIASHKLNTGTLSAEEWRRLAASADKLNTLPLYIDDTAFNAVQQIKAKLRRIKNLGLVVIDYLQLMGAGNVLENRVAVISEITRQLKIMAKELDVPVILISQLSRGVESRQNKRPMLSDLRESGSIEQDADIVIFLYREAYYKKDSKIPNVAECIIAKNRHGETGTVKLYWNGAYTRFTSISNSECKGD